MRYYQRLEEGEESVMRSLDPLTRTIENTSAGDMLLFLIALDRKEQAEKMPTPEIIIGFND